MKTSPLAFASLPPSPSSPSKARDLVENRLRASNLEDFRGEAALLTSELVTNAVLHAKSVIDVDVDVDAARVRISVIDFGDGEPVLRQPDGEGGGYGLRLVDQMATSWGHERLEPFGKRVWFELAR